VTTPDHPGPTAVSIPVTPVRARSATPVLYDAPGPRARRISLIASVITGVVLLALFVWFVTALASPRVTANGQELPGAFDPSRWDIFLDWTTWRAVGNGVLATLQAAVVAAILALLLGMLLSLLRSARTRWITVPISVVLEAIRGVPVLLMMLFVLLVLSTDQYWAVVVALALYNGAIIGEALRAGLDSLARGQREAGLSIGLTPLRTRLLIEFPQAFRQMTPIIVAQLVVLLKDTSLGYIVGYSELLRVMMNNLASFYGNRYLFSLFFVCLAVYLLINLTVSTIAKQLSKRLA